MVNVPVNWFALWGAKAIWKVPDPPAAIESGVERPAGPLNAAPVTAIAPTETGALFGFVSVNVFVTLVPHWT